MNKLLKFNSRNKKIFFTSDFHAFHNPNWDVPLWKMRGYNSMEEMNRDIITKTNAQVGPDDILFNLGDFALNSSQEQVENFLSQITCQNIYYLWGNHESSTQKIYKKTVKEFLDEELCIGSVPACGEWDLEIYPIRYKNIIFCGNYLECEIDKKRVVMSHFPFRVHNKSHHGSIHLNGHSHYSDKKRHVESTMGKSLDVGWDGKCDIYS